MRTCVTLSFAAVLGLAVGQHDNAALGQYSKRGGSFQGSPNNGNAWYWRSQRPRMTGGRVPQAAVTRSMYERDFRGGVPGAVGSGQNPSRAPFDGATVGNRGYQMIQAASRGEISWRSVHRAMYHGGYGPFSVPPPRVQVLLRGWNPSLDPYGGSTYGNQVYMLVQQALRRQIPWSYVERALYPAAASGRRR